MNQLNLFHVTREMLDLVGELSPYYHVIFDNKEIYYSDHDSKVCVCVVEDIMKNSFDLLKNSLGNDFSLIEHHCVGKDNSERWYELQSKLIIFEGKEAVLSNILDITDKKNADLENIRLSKIRSLMLEVTHSVVNTDEIDVFYSLILKNALAAIEKSNLGSIFIKRQDNFQCVSYIGFHESVMDFQLPVKHSFLYRASDGAMDHITYLNDIQPSDLNYPIKIDTGEQVYIKSSLSAPIFISGEIYGMINIDSLQANAFDDTDVKSMEFIRDNIEIAITNHILFQEKSQLAKYDRLTGLYNRHFFENQYEFIKEKALRYNETFNIVMFDVDDLKKVNDLYGHFVGDQVIRKIALEMRTSSRKSDLIARFGGDEIIAILFASDPDELSRKFTKLQLKLLDNPIDFFDERIKCSFSFGIASFPQEGQNFNDLLKIADARMYINKSKRQIYE